MVPPPSPKGTDLALPRDWDGATTWHCPPSVLPQCVQSGTATSWAVLLHCLGTCELAQAPGEGLNHKPGWKTELSHLRPVPGTVQCAVIAAINFSFSSDDDSLKCSPLSHLVMTSKIPGWFTCSVWNIKLQIMVLEGPLRGWLVNSLPVSTVLLFSSCISYPWRFPIMKRMAR